MNKVAAKAASIDYILLITAALLLILGILILSGVSAQISIEKFGSPYVFLNHQIIYGLIPGIILAIFCFIIPLSFFRKWSLVLLLINLVLVGMVFLPGIGSGFGGASRWLNLGPVSFQPSELLKITFLLFLVSWLVSKTENIHSRKKNQKKWLALLFPFLFIIAVLSSFLIFQPDISTLGIIVLVSFLLYFLSGTPLWHNFLLIFAGGISLFSLIKLAPYRMNRLLVLLNPEIDPMGIGYQVKQALITVGSGGIAGSGLGFGLQKFGFLPQTISDSIFAIFAEETGLVGSLILITLFLIFFWRGVKISNASQNKFSKLLSLGICSWISLQAFVNISSMLGILPLTGIPLPFISYGGSHLIAELMGAGILLNISRNTT
jgi:cell division protein FtsW